MRILIVSNLFPPDVIGGYELGCCRIAQGLAAGGHDIAVATSRVEPGTDDSVLVEVDPRLRIHRVFHPVREMILNHSAMMPPRETNTRSRRMALVDGTNCVALTQVIALENPDVLYVFNPLGLGPLSILESATASLRPVVLHLMDNIDHMVIGLLRPVGLRSRYAALKQHITAIATSSRCLELNSRLGLFRDAKVILGGVEDSFDGPGVARTSAVFRFVCSGLISSQKGSRQLLQAFRDARQRSGLAMELHLIGQVRPEALDDAALADPGIVLHGHRERSDVIRMIRSMDAGVYPLRRDEPFGYAAVECLAAEVPAVIPRTAGCAEMLPDEYPLFIPDGDSVAEMALLMIRLASEPALHRAALDSFNTIRQKFEFRKTILPAIERALLDARCSVSPPQFTGSAARIASIEKTTIDFPDLVFGQPPAA